MRSIAPQLLYSPKFHSSISDGAVKMPGGEVAYRVDLKRFDAFFDHLCHGIYFDRYGIQLDDATYQINHSYLSLSTSDPAELERQGFLRDMLGYFYEDFAKRLGSTTIGPTGDVVYANKIIDPLRHLGSVTVAHTFYGVFDVVSLLTRQIPAA